MFERGDVFDEVWMTILTRFVEPTDLLCYTDDMPTPLPPVWATVSAVTDIEVQYGRHSPPDRVPARTVGVVAYHLPDAIGVMWNNGVCCEVLPEEVNT